MTITILPPDEPGHTPGLPNIIVFGVGGAGGNAVNNMISSSLNGVEFVVANTDAQALANSLATNRIQLGVDTTRGLGAGSEPEVGRLAAEENEEEIAAALKDANMAFITAGMGGGTGTGAAPVVARIAREMGILTIGVVTKPFQYEGHMRAEIAERGVDELGKEVDTLIVIPNQNLFLIANERTTFREAFRLADDVLYDGVRSITDMIVNPGIMNVDFADVRRVMLNMGRAMMGTGEAEGDRRALDAAETALKNPLLENTSIRGAKAVLVNFIGGADLTLFEVDEAAERVRQDVEGDALIIVGSSQDEKLSGRVRVSVVAAGIGAESAGYTNVRTTPAPAVVAPAPASRMAAPGGLQPLGGTTAPASAPLSAPYPTPVRPAASAAAASASTAPAAASKGSEVAASDNASLISEGATREVLGQLNELVVEMHRDRETPRPGESARPELQGDGSPASARPVGPAPFAPPPSMHPQGMPQSAPAPIVRPMPYPDGGLLRETGFLPNGAGPAPSGSSMQPGAQHVTGSTVLQPNPLPPPPLPRSSEDKGSAQLTPPPLGAIPGREPVASQPQQSEGFFKRRFFGFGAPKNAQPRAKVVSSSKDDDDPDGPGAGPDNPAWFRRQAN
ncbi:cell division protein FtsZ [Phaeovibrio sulfidiphilus]|uniref:Cell division protein FtsZ n=1 Tax=Phaeovibrio sulfidiphilus TaxID=1220600 RepID=A0A8J6YZW1_9PROT|nr:cell division protein FtsZ [Phaeovibrio sulfidiphilus]MBE1237523.1 cell division protein FtsZ [Phaeovibrio sulfidiphilus]